MVIRKQEAKIESNSDDDRDASLESLKRATEQVKQQLKSLNAKTKQSQSTNQSSGKKKICFRFLSNSTIIFKFFKTWKVFN